VATYLDHILAAHHQAVAADWRDVGALANHAALAPPTRGFAAALGRAAAGGELAVVAEIKRRSPSKGNLAADLDPATVAGQYAAGGATCLSVLTDAVFFGGSPDDLAAARAAVALPVLRKDFTVGLADVYDGRIMGADAVLLIAAAIADDGTLGALASAATDVGLDVLFEVHDEGELDRVLRVGATLIGVNQRDLVTFEVDHARAERMAAAIPAGVLAVAESGVRGPDDAARLAAAGYHAVLVGEGVVTASDPAQAVASLRVPVGVR
jgi:indole-3-glycerol phosphate synthase